MKLWNQYGSEHSMNLVMIGSFKQPGDAEAAKLLRDEITEQVKREPDLLKERPPGESRFSKEMMDFLIKSHLNTVGAAELEQFLYDVSVEKKGNKVILRAHPGSSDS